MNDPKSIPLSLIHYHRNIVGNVILFKAIINKSETSANFDVCSL